ncbi:hypothetical protein EMIHUDRAFT_121838 [Emiliania huxleyi CCMP1516]|uniref:AP2/ERF domain-containing protein n=2 Tax=Emiliania huxleyi TaxID=2903 RepID=A0A0D3KYI2_EMIH1|nr:hypothetical protein EMIHUDRAFT_121838 [Emiliania huxleyi CCMP1516]EOD40817.1 hypothetical protein EMIHUDRAFT_121838 [Emiliania huxleyi CCMP1516]|eukprot:XP_005793246.1 hypothetical protein EMIHUDRAFT_121838 [Emiliania huxleyi CCMP1516]
MASHNGLICWMCLGEATHACPRCDPACGTAVCLTCFEKAARQADTKRKLGRLRHDALDWTGASRGERPLRPVDMATTPASPCQRCTRECLQPQLVLLPAPAPTLAAGPGGQQAPPVPVPAVEAAAATAAPATPAEVLPAEAASPPAGGAAAPSAGSASWLTFIGTTSAWVGEAVLEAAAEGTRRAKRRRCEGGQREGGGEEEEEAPRGVGSSGRARLGGPSADEAGGGGAPPAAPVAQAAARTITAAGAEAVRQADREGLTLATGSSNSGYKGVCYRPKQSGSKKYKLTVTSGGKQVHLGMFATAEQAALFYARKEAGRDTCDLTAPPPPRAPTSPAGAEAVRQAEREGLTLATSSSNNSGYKGVVYEPTRSGSKKYKLRVTGGGGKSVHLGLFATAEQAALFYARKEAGRDTCDPTATVWDGSDVLLMGLGQEGDREGEVVSAVWDGSDVLLMGLGQEGDREGEVVSAVWDGSDVLLMGLGQEGDREGEVVSAVWDGSDVLLMGLGQEGDREGEVVRWEAGASACDLVAMQVARSVVCGYCSNLRETRPTYYDCIHALGA